MRLSALGQRNMDTQAELLEEHLQKQVALQARRVILRSLGGATVLTAIAFLAPFLVSG